MLCQQAWQENFEQLPALLRHIRLMQSQADGIEN